MTEDALDRLIDTIQKARVLAHQVAAGSPLIIQTAINLHTVMDRHMGFAIDARVQRDMKNAPRGEGSNLVVNRKD